MKIIVCGDVHGYWHHLNCLIEKEKPDVILQCGDFGWWPHFHGKSFIKDEIFNQFGIENGDTKIYWVPGNHENWNDLKCITDYDPYEIQDNIFYCPFGTVLEIGDLNILCCGGAESTDKYYRTEDYTWWKDEIISQEDMDNLPDCKIDVVISHTIPTTFIEEANWIFSEKYKDPSRKALDMILYRYNPKKWFSGHFHHSLRRNINNCEWTALNMSNYTGWWTYFKGEAL